MRILFLDYETAGLPGTPNFVPTELGYVVFDSAKDRIIKAHSMLTQCTQNLSPEITALTGIDNSLLNSYAHDREYAAQCLAGEIEESQLVVVWQGYFFDRLLARQEIELAGFVLQPRPWYDAKLDHATKTSLGHTAADLGFLNPFPHSAIGDALCTLEVCRRRQLGYDIAAKLAQSPFIHVEAMVDFQHKDLAKLDGFVWDTIRPRAWIRIMREDQARQFSQRPGAKYMVRFLSAEAT